MRNQHRPTVSALIACAGMMLALTACDSDPGPETDTSTATRDPTTTDPSPTDTETTVDYQQQQVEAASHFIHDRYATSSEVANNHYEGWREKVLPYYQGSDELTARWIPTYEALEESGYYSEGETVVKTLTVSDWVEDPEGNGLDRVSFDICVDPSGVTTYTADGDPLDESQVTSTPYLVDATVMGQPDSTLGWSFSAETQHLDTAC
jgi:hypothetical protein